jgi:plasmid stabilization system protein ParE
LALVSYSEHALQDFERIFEFLALDDEALAAGPISMIADAVSVLERHPGIGRTLEKGLRELVVSRGRSGYVALHRYNEVTDAILVLAIRHQKEARYQDTIAEISSLRLQSECSWVRA